jgi:hypothetical protein
LGAKIKTSNSFPWISSNRWLFFLGIWFGGWG